MSRIRAARFALCAIAATSAVPATSTNMEPNPPPEDRVGAAKRAVGLRLLEKSRSLGFAEMPRRIFIRAFKSEKELELWGAVDSASPMKLIDTYAIAGMSGTLGPKRREGDLQVPEGVYHIDRFNPLSRFHLSLGINYPNASDRVRSDRERPGGDIFIHGDTRSIGCLAMTDEKIKQIYLFASAAREAGQARIPVHIFPFRLSTEGLSRLGAFHKSLLPFWLELKPIYDHFERTQRIPTVAVKPDGTYSLPKR